MTLKTIAGAVLALLVVTGTAAALPGAAPAQADDHANDDAAAAADADADSADADDANASESGDANARADNAERRGPPTDLPDQVPDFVGDVHDLIDQKLAGDLTGSLGEQISSVTPDEGDENATDAGDAPAENATDAPAGNATPA
ncbi:hypothetical protein [Halomicrobium salinisoli]|uniref:hypothetical protein n=1 Tax=Halomicrobium salinisoli TaxID=2878391 RepID=UPI001CF077BE|nr:hypothetical protein [Halomicrobium salinisoli]